MKTIKQGGLYRYYKNDQDWAVVMGNASSIKTIIFGQVISISKKCSLVSLFGGKIPKKGSIFHFNKSDFTYLPNCELSFVCKPKNPKKEKELVVEGEYYFETTKGKKR